jgi:glucose/arabinose dehydrogenase
VDLQSANDGSDRLFVVEQAGVVRVFGNKSDVANSAVFMDIQDRVKSGGELGLLGLAFPPDFKRSQVLYVNYTSGGPLRTLVSRFRVKNGVADPASEQVLLTIPQPYRNHNGGQVQFGPDGMLYIAVGDGGSGGDPHNHGQNRRTLLGTIVRIDVSGAGAYTVPKDNPFFANSKGWREEIWAYGLRNPWRFSFDPKTGRLWAGDVGQNLLEEVDVIKRGGNYGWRRLEGTDCYEPRVGCRGSEQFENPVWEYGRSEGVSITGGYVYRGDRLPGLRGSYIFADFGSQRIWALRADKRRPRAQLLTRGGVVPSSFGTDARGELYVVSHNGALYRIEAR